MWEWTTTGSPIFPANSQIRVVVESDVSDRALSLLPRGCWAAVIPAVVASSRRLSEHGTLALMGVEGRG